MSLGEDGVRCPYHTAAVGTNYQVCFGRVEVEVADVAVAELLSSALGRGVLVHVVVVSVGGAG